MPAARALSVRRPRVDGLFADAPVTIVGAGRGAGKSAAVAAWLRSSALDGVWITVTADRTRPADFWAGLASDLPGIGHRDDESAPSEVVAGAFARLPAGAVVVLDGAHDLEPGIVDDLVEFVDRFPDLRVVLLTRRLSALSAQLWEREPLIVTGERLAFTRDETASMFDAAGVHAPAGVLAALHASSAGIPLLVDVMARALSGQGVSGDWLSPAQVNVMVDAVERVFTVSDLSSTPPRWADPVRAAALLVDATTDEAASVAGIAQEDAREMFDAAASVGWGEWDREAEVFSFSPADARALSLRLVLKRNRPVLVRAVHALSARGEGMRALTLAFAAEDDDLILRVASRHASSLVRHHREILVGLEHISRHRVGQSPLIAMAIALCHAQDPASRLPMLMNYARAERLARAGTSSARSLDRVILHLVRSFALRSLGRHSWAHRAAVAAVRLLEELPDSTAAKLLVSPGVAYGQAALTALSAGDVLGARDFSERAIGVAKASEMVRHHELAKAGLFAAIDGNLDAARRHLDAASMRPVPEQYIFRVAPRLAEAIIAVESGDTAAARRLIDDVGPRLRTAPLRPVADAILAVADALDGNLQDASARLRAALEHSEGPARSRSEENLLATLALGIGLAGGDVGARGVGRSHAASRLGLVVAAARHLAAGDAIAAVADTSTALSSTGTVRVRASLLLLRTAAALRLGGTAAARRDLATAIDVLAGGRLRTPWLVLTTQDREAVLDLLSGMELLPAPLVHDLRTLRISVSVGEAIPRLTGRERAVLEGILARETNVDIAARLGISPNTVKKQRASLYRKLGAGSWDDAVRAALEHGLLDVG